MPCHAIIYELICFDFGWLVDRSSLLYYRTQTAAQYDTVLTVLMAAMSDEANTEKVLHCLSQKIVNTTSMSPTNQYCDTVQVVRVSEEGKTSVIATKVLCDDSGVLFRKGDCEPVEWIEMVFV